MTTRYIFITGGVVSSLGKGLASASIAVLLQARGYKVRIRKFDPYLNVDPGTMSPFQHGEVYVTEDGGETDLDLGHYERFTGVEAHKTDNVTTGQIYSQLIAKERRGDYLGGTVQVIPHVTDLIKEFIQRDIKGTDFVLCEIGGTVGDIEGQPFLEAIRQLGYKIGRDRALYVHLTLVPYLSAARELKTKPTQHSVRELRAIGLQPNILLCRSEHEIPKADRQKIALFSNVPEEAVFEALDAKSIYEVPLNYHKQGVDDQILKHFGLPNKKEPALDAWKKVVRKIEKTTEETTIAIVGKYTVLKDAYKSLIEAVYHAGIANGTTVNIKWIDARSEDLKKLEKVQGIIVPGGFGEGGIEGKIAAARYARENGVPYLGICFGMQMAVIETARHLAGIKDASSTEFGPCANPVIGLMTEWVKSGGKERRAENSDLGGTMRLGSYPCKIKKDSLAHKIYGDTNIIERHRHRYEVNASYIPVLEKAGLKFSGMSPDGKLPEIVEIPDHPWFVGVQFHPEFKSTIFKPHPLFSSFIEAVKKRQKG